MRTVRQAAMLALAGALLGAPALAHAQQVHPGETEGLGLMGPRIPSLLKEVAADPYRAPAQPACETIPAELVALNQMLGVDADQPRPKKSLVKKATNAVIGAARGFIPYRGEVRFLTQADKRDHQLMDATQAAWARRGFLRGLEANLHCAGDDAEGALDASGAEPLAPPPDTRVATLDPPPAANAPAAFQRAPGQPWQLPPPAADPAAAQSASDPAAVMLRPHRDDDGSASPGR